MKDWRACLLSALKDPEALRELAREAAEVRASDGYVFKVRAANGIRNNFDYKLLASEGRKDD